MQIAAWHPEVDHNIEIVLNHGVYSQISTSKVHISKFKKKLDFKKRTASNDNWVLNRDRSSSSVVSYRTHEQDYRA